MDKTNGKIGKNTKPKDRGPKSRVTEIIQAWMIVRLSEALKIAPAEIGVGQPLLIYGLDSLTAFTLTGELAERLGRDLPTTLFWDFPTLEALAEYLADEIKDGNAQEALLAEISHALSKVEELPEDEPL
jgi:acyl carrier protein